MQLRSLRAHHLASLLSALVAMMAISIGEAAACAICFSGITVSVGQMLDSADQAVLAVPLSEEGQFRIVAVVKGDVAADEPMVEPSLSAEAAGALLPLDGPAIDSSAPTAQNGKPLLLLRNKLAQHWASVGAIDAEYAWWLRRLAASNHGGEARPARTWPTTTLTWSYLSDDEWLERVMLVAPYLEDPEPLAAEIAFGEIARAPHSARRSLKPLLDAATIAGWIDDPKLAPRQAAYTMLLGIAGGPDDADRLEQRLETAWKARDATNLAAMLAADLELRGPARVAWVEEMYFADRQRTMPEINAALLALSVLGAADGAVPRERVIQAYRFFIRERKPMAGFVALELADWEAWDATADYAAILEANAVKDPAGHFAIVTYLQRSPDPAAKAAMRSFLDQSN